MTAQQNAKRQGDIGTVGVMKRGAVELIDITVSDNGGSRPSLDSFTPGKLCEERAQQKVVTYTTRFNGIERKQLVILSFDAMGGMTKETEDWIRHLIKLLAGADPSTPASIVARRTWSRIAVSLQTSIAVNALSFFNGKLLPPSRAPGQSQRQVTQPQPSSQAQNQAPAQSLVQSTSRPSSQPQPSQQAARQDQQAAQTQTPGERGLSRSRPRAQLRRPSGSSQTHDLSSQALGEGSRKRGRGDSVGSEDGLPLKLPVEALQAPRRSRRRVAAQSLLQHAVEARGVSGAAVSSGPRDVARRLLAAAGAGQADEVGNFYASEMQSFRLLEPEPADVQMAAGPEQVRGGPVLGEPTEPGRDPPAPALGGPSGSASGLPMDVDA